MTKKFFAALVFAMSVASPVFAQITGPRVAPLLVTASNTVSQQNSTAPQRFNVANTYTSATNNELFSVDWQTAAGVAIVGTRTAATGTGRKLFLASQLSSGSGVYSGIAIDGANSSFRFGSYDTTFVSQARSVTGTNVFAFEHLSSAASGTLGVFAVTPTYNQVTSTAANTDLLINRTETAIGTGAQLLMDLQRGGTSQFNVDRIGQATSISAFVSPRYQLFTGGTSSGSASRSDTIIKNVTGIANAVATDIFTVTVPNAQNMATITVVHSCSLGAGGAIGAGEATATLTHSITVTRTAGLATAIGGTTYGVNNAAVAGAATITLASNVSAISGANNATQTFTITATVTRGSGASTNHTCRSTAEIINANASGITIQ